MENPFVHVELRSKNLDRSRDFYGRLFSWELETVPMGEMSYTVIRVGDGVGGGMMASPDPVSPSHWLPFVGVDDVAGVSETARELGATVVQGKTPIPGGGFFAVIADPTGAALGLLQHS